MEILSEIVLCVTFLIQSIALLLIFSVTGFVFYQNSIHLLAIIFSEIFHYITTYFHYPEHIFFKVFSYIFSVNLMNGLSIYLLHPHEGIISLHTWTIYQSVAWTGFLFQIAIECTSVLLKYNDTGNLSRLFRLRLASLSIIMTCSHLIYSFHLNDSLEFILLMKCSIDAIFHGFKSILFFLSFDEALPSFITTVTPILMDLVRQILWFTITTVVFCTNIRIRSESILFVAWIMIICQYLFGSIRLFYALFVQIVLAYKFASVFKKLHPDELAEISADDTCPICLLEHSHTTRRMPCGHLLHMPCATRMMQQNRNAGNNPHRCPVCRRDLFDSSSFSASTMSSGTQTNERRRPTTINNTLSNFNMFDIVTELRGRRSGLFERTTDRNANPFIRVEIQTFGAAPRNRMPIMVEARIHQVNRSTNDQNITAQNADTSGSNVNRSEFRQDRSATNPRAERQSTSSTTLSISTAAVETSQNLSNRSLPPTSQPQRLVSESADNQNTGMPSRPQRKRRRELRERVENDDSRTVSSTTAQEPSAHNSSTRRRMRRRLT